MFWIPIQGTNSWPEQPQREWWFAGDALDRPSPFVLSLAGQGWHVWNAADPFVWSTDVDGLGFLRLFTGGGDKNDWRAGGKALRWYLADMTATDRAQLVLLAHSHGLQVVLEALAHSPAVSIAGVISVGSPIRADMAAVARAARPQMGFWLHLRAKWDLWQRLGQVCDGDVNVFGRWPKHYPRPDLEEDIRGIGSAVHGQLLRDPDQFERWPAWLRAVETAAERAA